LAILASSRPKCPLSTHEQDAFQTQAKTALVDRRFPDEPSLETIRDNLLIGDVETVAEKLIGEIRATHPVHVCFSFKVGNTEHKAAMRSMELMIGEVKPKIEKKVLGAPIQDAAK